MKLSNGKIYIYLVFVLLFIVWFITFYVDFGGREHFAPNGCSLFPDRYMNIDYRDCCINHDSDYFAGGSQNMRKAADNALFRCVVEKDLPVWAHVIYWGVRIGGSPHLPLNFRWGFTHPYGHGYSL